MKNYICQYLSCYNETDKDNKNLCKYHKNEKIKLRLKIIFKMESNFINLLKKSIIHKLFIYKNKRKIYDTIIKYETILYDKNYIKDNFNYKNTILIHEFLHLENKKINLKKLYTLTKYINGRCFSISTGTFLNENSLLDDKNLEDVCKIIKDKDTQKKIVSKSFSTKPIVFSIYYKTLFKLKLPEDVILFIMTYI